MERAGHDGPGGALAAGLGLRQGLYLLAVFIDTVGSGLWMPVGLIFFTRAQQIPVAQVGTALTLGGLVGLLAGPISGSLVDRWGPARFVFVSNVARAVVFALYPLVGSAWQIALLAAVFSASDRLFWTANTPLLSQFVRGRRLDRILGTQNVVRIVGLGLGAALSGLFAGSVQGLHWLAYVNALSFVVAAGVLLAAVSMRAPARADAEADAPAEATGADRPAHPVGWRAVLADRPFVLLCGVQGLYALCALSLVVILPLVALDPLGGPTWLPGASIVVGNVVLALAQNPAVRLAEKTSRLRGLLISSATFAVTFVLMSFGTDVAHSWVVPLVLAVSVLGVVGEALFGPMMTAAANDAAPERLRGRYSALFQTSWGLATVLAPALFTLLLAVDHRVLWLSAAGMALLTVPGLLVAGRRLPAAVLHA
ncbi:MAG TPA: MFS transporter [Micromonosporaceae bacterium]|nr:MFS transporter [Micromonosporaceae bacterium]